MQHQAYGFGFLDVVQAAVPQRMQGLQKKRRVLRFTKTGVAPAVLPFFGVGVVCVLAAHMHRHGRSVKALFTQAHGGFLRQAAQHGKRVHGVAHGGRQHV